VENMGYRTPYRGDHGITFEERQNDQLEERGATLQIRKEKNV